MREVRGKQKAARKAPRILYTARCTETDIYTVPPRGWNLSGCRIRFDP